MRIKYEDLKKQTIELIRKTVNENNEPSTANLMEALVQDDTIPIKQKLLMTHIALDYVLGTKMMITPDKGMSYLTRKYHEYREISYRLDNPDKRRDAWNKMGGSELWNYLKKIGMNPERALIMWEHLEKDDQDKFRQSIEEKE